MVFRKFDKLNPLNLLPKKQNEEVLTEVPLAPKAAIIEEVRPISPKLTKNESYLMYYNIINAQGTGIINEKGEVEPLLRCDNRQNLVHHVQNEFVANGFLDGELMREQYGHMRGTLTIQAARDIEVAMANIGADIQVEDINEVKIGIQVVAASRAIREFGGKAALANPEVAKAVVQRYEEIKAENMLEKAKAAGAYATNGEHKAGSYAATDVNFQQLAEKTKERA